MVFPKSSCQARPENARGIHCRTGERTTDDAGAELAAEEYLMHLLGQLPPMYGAVLVLRLRDGLTYRQIAERLGVTVRSVKRHMEIVLAHLRRAQW